MNDIRDWCISRQQWWGHQIPAFYDESGKVFVAENEEAARRKYNIPTEIKLVQDDDVLETWFSSSLWPIATMGWPEASKDLDTYLPSQVLITGHDIIFFIVARMIMMTLNLAGKSHLETFIFTDLSEIAKVRKCQRPRVMDSTL